MSSNTEIVRDLDRLEWLAVSYLFLPVPLFLLGWLLMRRGWPPLGAHIEWLGRLWGRWGAG